jgi:hypothetical protein
MRFYYKEDGPVVEIPDNPAIFMEFVAYHTEKGSSVVRIDLTRNCGPVSWTVLDCEGVFALETGTAQAPDRELKVWFRNRKEPLYFLFGGMPLDRNTISPDMAFQQYLEAKKNGGELVRFYCALFGYGASDAGFAILWDDVVSVTVSKVEKPTPKPFKAMAMAAR